MSVRYFLYLCYYTFGWCLSFSAIAIRFTMIDKLKMSPVETGYSMVLISSPWCLKPFYGMISDMFPVFDWGNRRPYISFGFYFASFLYVYMHHVIESKFWFSISLMFISWSICYADVCTDSIMVSMAKKEKVTGNIQSICWGYRALGTLVGALSGGVAYANLGAIPVFQICAAVPLVSSMLVWCLPRIQLKPSSQFFSRLWKNVLEQRELALLLFIVNIAPDYGQFYAYFLQKEMGYTPAQFSWLSVSGSLTFLLATITFNRCLLGYPLHKIIFIGLVGTYICRMAQLLVVLRIMPYFWIVLCDGVAESFFGTIILMPLIVLVSKGCKDGVEGSLYSMMMAISNLSGLCGNWLGTVMGYLLGVTRESFDNMKWFITISAFLEFIIPLAFILRKTSFFENEEQVDTLDRTQEPEDPEILVSSKETSEIQEENKRAMSVNMVGFWGKRHWKHLSEKDRMEQDVLDCF